METETCAGISPLTARQTEVIKMVALGLNAGEIADVLGIGQQTVKNIKNRAYERLGMNKATEVTRWAVAQGLV
jgi:two-component system, NarL family, response regulator NreC